MIPADIEEGSKLKRIGERAFARCMLKSITIPASTEAMDGSAFVDSPLIEIRVSAGNQRFVVEGNMLLTSDKTELVRYFGRELEVHVPLNIEVLGKSCFEFTNQLETVIFA
jgi:hypothetical protein